MTVRHRNGSYDVDFVELRSLLADLPANSFAITDAQVAEALSNAFPQTLPRLAIAPGESSKSLESFGECLNWLATVGADRRSTIIAVGGGVVGDLAGFVAAAYMRGVACVQCPTSLLAQVDSSVGGKVGVDLAEGKNLAGAFHPPVQVRVAMDALQTLPAIEFANGMAEVWKHAFIFDSDLAALLGERPLTPGDDRLAAVVRRCIELKARVVESDEFETTGERAKLNFGHTVGHAIEQVCGYRGVRHGEAISVGMVVESHLGEALGVSAAGTADRIAHGLASAGLPTQSRWDLDADRLIAAMKRDKKSESGRLAFSLVVSIGECKLFPSVPESDVRKALNRI